jgi:SAM-dependent methyltransferase
VALLSESWWKAVGGAKGAARAIMPAPMLDAVRRHQRRLHLGALRRVQPISRSFGLDRGQPIDRYYIERFLAAHAADVRGRVLEIGEDTSTRRVGGRQVARCDVLHVQDGNPRATIVDDLARGERIPPDSFDCVICTQTLMFIYDVRAAVATLKRILKPGGVVLATMAGISQVCRFDSDRWGDYWRFTSMAAARLFEDEFGPGHAHVEGHGNVLAAVAFLHGLCAQDLREDELGVDDRDYELVIAVRAQRAAGS